MCGIVGIFTYSRRPLVDLAEVLRIRDAMETRGPDDAGSWNDTTQRVAFGHRRLAIIDITSSGAQPMIDEAHGLTIIFNGEIYNFKELRAELEVKGYRFKSNSDTEVLLAAYALRGPEMVRMLRGMFAFAIWDGHKKQLFLARDPFGIKPLYYSVRDGTFRFASQVKALRAGGVAGRGESSAGHVGFFLWGHIPDPNTLYADIKSVPAGSTITVSEHGITGPANYWSVNKALLSGLDRSKDLPSTEEDRNILIRHTLKESVKYHLIADVPVGIFLSAGRDAATILALSREIENTKIQTFTLGFSEYKDSIDDETKLAALLATEYGSRHCTSWIAREDFLAEFERLLRVMDQPSTDGINVYMMCREGQRSGIKVALTGIGGDELFGGYPSFRQVPALIHAVQRIPFARVLGRRARELVAPALKYLTSPKYAGLIEYGLTYSSAFLLRRALFMPWEIDNILGPETTRAGLEELEVDRTLYGSVEGLKESHSMMLALEMDWYMRDRLLRDADWASMAHSLELRTPYVDHVVLESLAPVLMSTHPYTKFDMSMTPQHRLPDVVLGRPKTGFSVPVREWLVAGSVANSSERGLRGWAKMVYTHQTDRPLGAH